MRMFAACILRASCREGMRLASFSERRMLQGYFLSAVQERSNPVRKELGTWSCAEGETVENKRGCSFEQPLENLVASIGFEPTISALRGRRPKPLDDEAIGAYWLGWKESNPHIRYQKPLSYH